MLVRCRICGKFWKCRKESCQMPKRTCEVCAECRTKEIRSRIELVLQMNPDCYSKGNYPLSFNPSSRESR